MHPLGVAEPRFELPAEASWVAKGAGVQALGGVQNLGFRVSGFRV